MSKKVDEDLMKEAMLIAGEECPFLDGPHIIVEAKEQEFSRMQKCKAEGMLWLLGAFITFICGLNQAIKAFCLAGGHSGSVVLCEYFMHGYSNTNHTE